MRLRFDFPDPLADCRSGAPTIAREFAEPRQVFVARTIDDVEPTIRAAEAAALAGRWVAGFLTYEAASGFDAALVTHAPSRLPIVWFATFDAPSTPAPEPPQRAVQPSSWTSRLSDDEYLNGFAAVKNAIAAGDVYQANYTLRPDAAWDEDSIWLRYLSLLAAHRPSYAACLDLDDIAVLSLSPELLLRRHGLHVVTSPIKGTRSRGRWREEDLERCQALATSEKDQAENVMIVDLARNDLGRVCAIGSVRVHSLFDVRRYRTAWQMVSTVTGTLRPGATLTDTLKAVFLAGSITGAPKTSAMKLIRDIEPDPRGIYCDAVGLMAPGGDAIFNVAIRTAVFQRHPTQVSLGVGGGVTWDSTPAGELSEARLKARFLEPLRPFALVETLRYDGASLVRWPQHLARLLSSAAYFELPVESARVTAALTAHAALWPSVPRRIRVTVAQDGTADVTSQPLDALPIPVRVALSSRPVDSDDVFLCHKTTNRGVYEAARTERQDVFDVLLTNERGDLTEFTIGNVVLELGGRLLTPPRGAGLLAGVFRDELLLGGQAKTGHLSTLQNRPFPVSGIEAE
jgi:para-aminobenzoate synthetase/4-amino-4-deoxychorismate lyase